jgi:hypothetical protein
MRTFARHQVYVGRRPNNQAFGAVDVWFVHCALLLDTKARMEALILAWGRHFSVEAVSPQDMISNGCCHTMEKFVIGTKGLRLQDVFCYRFVCIAVRR